MTEPTRVSNSPWNVPNLLTTIRLALALIVMIGIYFHAWWTSLVLFTIAATTDWADGYWARKYGQITKLGRIFDPFVDKIIICGTFIALVAVPKSGISAGLAILVVARELLVTSLRGIIEGAGGDFSARWLGKWKMVAQCAAGVLVLLALALENPPTWLHVLKGVSIVATAILTVWSAVDYISVAAKSLGVSTPPNQDNAQHG